MFLDQFAYALMDRHQAAGLQQGWRVFDRAVIERDGLAATPSTIANPVLRSEGPPRAPGSQKSKRALPSFSVEEVSKLKLNVGIVCTPTRK